MVEAVLTEADNTLSQAEIKEKSSALRQSLIDSLSKNPLYTKAAAKSDVLGENDVEWEENGTTYRIRNTSSHIAPRLIKMTEIEVDTPDSREHTGVPWNMRPGRVIFVNKHSEYSGRNPVSEFETKDPAPEARVYKGSAIAFEKAEAMLAPLLTKKG